LFFGPAAPASDSLIFPLHASGEVRAKICKTAPNGDVRAFRSPAIVARPTKVIGTRDPRADPRGLRGQIFGNLRPKSAKKTTLAILLPVGAGGTRGRPTADNYRGMRVGWAAPPSAHSGLDRREGKAALTSSVLLLSVVSCFHWGEPNTECLGRWFRQHCCRTRQPSRMIFGGVS